MDDEWVTIGHGGCFALARDQTGASGHDLSRTVVWSLTAKLDVDGLTASTSFWLGPDGVEDGLDWFFGWLASDWRGWDGARVWAGMEGGLELSCTHDGVGTVIVEVRLHHLSGAGWTAVAHVIVDAGEEMATLARNVEALLTV